MRKRLVAREEKKIVDEKVGGAEEGKVDEVKKKIIHILTYDQEAGCRILRSRRHLVIYQILSM